MRATDRPGPTARVLACTAAASVALLVGGCGQGEPEPVATIQFHDPDGLAGSRLPKPYVVPDVRLTSSEGRPYDVRADTTRPWTLVFFGYTHCPDVCQIVMSSLASALTRLPGDEAEQVQVLFVTSDPARDDAATLRSYLDRFNPDFEGLTGDLATIKRFGEALGVPIGRSHRLPSGGYDVTHGANVVAVDSRDRGSVVWTQGTSPSQFAEDLHVLIRR